MCKLDGCISLRPTIASVLSLASSPNSIIRRPQSRLHEIMSDSHLGKSSKIPKCRWSGSCECEGIRILVIRSAGLLGVRYSTGVSSTVQLLGLFPRFHHLSD